MTSSSRNNGTEHNLQVAQTSSSNRKVGLILATIITPVALIPYMMMRKQLQYFKTTLSELTTTHAALRKDVRSSVTGQRDRWERLEAFLTELEKEKSKGVEATKTVSNEMKQGFNKLKDDVADLKGPLNTAQTMPTKLVEAIGKKFDSIKASQEQLHRSLWQRWEKRDEHFKPELMKMLNDRREIWNGIWKKDIEKTGQENEELFKKLMQELQEIKQGLNALKSPSTNVSNEAEKDAMADVDVDVPIVEAAPGELLREHYEPALHYDNPMEESAMQRSEVATEESATSKVAEPELVKLPPHVVQDLGEALADIAAFMHEVEVQHGLAPKANDGRGIDRLRRLALVLRKVSETVPDQKQA